jgi:hypothetical protein
VKLVRVIAFAVFFVAAPVASPAQSLDLPLLSAQCTVFDDPEDMPVGSIQPRNEDGAPTDDKANAAPANEQETIASRVIVLVAPSEISSEVADDVATTGPTARRIPAAAEPVEDTRTIE